MLVCDVCSGENKAEKGNMSNRVDVFERMTRRSPFDMPTLRKPLNYAKTEPVNVWRRSILDKGESAKVLRQERV